MLRFRLFPSSLDDILVPLLWKQMVEIAVRKVCMLCVLDVCLACAKLCVLVRVPIVCAQLQSSRHTRP